MASSPFRFLHEPRTEQEVVGVFVAILDDIEVFPKPVVIERIREAFPDCTIRAAGVPINVEFKLYAESYNYEFDDSVLVCWKKGKERQWPTGFRVVELGPIVETRRPDLILFNDDTYAQGRPWCMDSFLADANRAGCPDYVIAVMHHVMQWAAKVGCGPIWRKDPKPQFDVGSNNAMFTVWSDGKLRPVLKRFSGTDELTLLLHELNRAVPSLGLSVRTVKQKKRIPFAEHFADVDSLRRWLLVWEEFHRRQSVASAGTSTE